MNRCIRLGLFVFLILVCCFSTGCTRGARDIPEGSFIAVYYSSDVNGRLDGCGCKQNNGGIARRSSLFRAAREEDPAVVYCDAGNFLSGTPAADASNGKVLIEAYNRLKPTAVNLSERELTFGVDVFKSLKREAKFDFVSANLRYKGGALTNPYVIHNVREARVAFIGLCGTRDVMRSDSNFLPTGISVEDPLTAARRTVAALEGKADVLILLSTCGDEVDSALARALPQLDVIIGGRSYRTNADNPWIIEKTRVVRAEHDGRSLGRMNLVFGAHNQLKAYMSAQIELGSKINADEDMLALIRNYVPDFRESGNPTQ